VEDFGFVELGGDLVGGVGVPGGDVFTREFLEEPLELSGNACVAPEDRTTSECVGWAAARVWTMTSALSAFSTA